MPKKVMQKVKNVSKMHPSLELIRILNSQAKSNAFSANHSQSRATKRRDKQNGRNASMELQTQQQRLRSNLV